MKQMRTIYNIAAVASALLLAACADRDVVENVNGYVNYSVSVAGTGEAVASKSLDMCSADGTVIPLSQETFDGMGEVSQAESKGSQLNTSGSNVRLSTCLTAFNVAAWENGDTHNAFIPAYTTVSYSAGVWSTATAYKWKKDENKIFYAYANLPASGATVSNANYQGQTLEYTVPANAKEQNDILMGCYSGDGSGAGTASINFYHPLTAVVFKQGELDGVSKIKSITIKNVYTSGSTTQSTTTGKSFSWTSLVGSQNVSQSNTNGLSVLNKVIGTPFILIPQDLASKNVTLEVVAVVNSSNVTFTATLNSGSWEAGKTNVYTIGYDSSTFKFTIDNDNPIFANSTKNASKTLNVTSTKTKNSTTTGVGWNIVSYKVGTGSETSVTGNSFEAGGLTVGKDGNKINVTAAKRQIFNPGSHDNWGVESWASKGAIDLSKFDYRTESESAMNTANCYIIRHAGTYRIPLVYGNGVKNGSENVEAYKPLESGKNALTTFLNHLDKGITSAFIENNSNCTVNSASILWQDMATNISGVRIVGETKSTYNVGNVRYLEFTVDADKICQNNAVIAVKDNNGTIIWSWHVWITNDASIMNGPIGFTNNGGVVYNFFPIGCLGWTDASNYPGRDDVLVTLKQETSGNTIVVNIGQQIVRGKSTGVFYQFGRKDPIPRENIKSGTAYTTNSDGNAVTIGKAIQTPNQFYKHKENWCKTNYTNLWAGKMTAGESWDNWSDDNSKMIKTIYDPSPVGYRLPGSNAFTGMSIDGKNITDASYDKIKCDNWDVTANSGYNFYTDNTRTSKIFFPAPGFRINNDVASGGHTSPGGTYYDMGVTADYWTGVTVKSSNMSWLAFFGISYESNILLTHQNGARSYGLSVRPVTE